MEDRDKNILNLNRELIIRDLHGDVFIDLYEQGILNVDEFNFINEGSFQETKNIKFLEVLSRKQNGLKPFMEALKDWYWWIEEKLRESSERKWQKTIYSSNIPPIHRRNVSRRALLEEVRSALKKLQKGHFVVLHGMSGCGKSSLAAEALHDDIFIDQFQGKVYWLSCCQESKGRDDSKVDENEILALQVQLNDVICNEELVSNVETLNVKKFTMRLAKRFQESDFKDGLIVLDDVHSAHVIEALNVGCKTLVITNNLDVMKNQGNRYHSIKVNAGFTEEESLQYLAQCVDLRVEQLPEKARQIHLQGKGHPLTISLIGAQLEAHQEEAKNNFNSWNLYLDVLISKNYGDLKRWSTGGADNLSRTIELCVNSLSSQMREKYEDFALFVEDVNIDIKVLEILWNLPSIEVKNIMNEFLNKSLVVRKYNKIKNRYVYGIHDLLLYYLKRETLNEKESMNLHRKLIERYKEVCKGDVALLPRDDNYFFYYIGHHIAQAKLNSLFPEWYFNLDFIEAKIKVAGPGDLLLDYKRYKPHFVGDSFESAKISRKLIDFVKFVESAGMDVRRNNGPDIIQLALQEPHDSEVYKTALRVAHSRTDSTYLHFPLGPSISRSGPYMIQTKDKVSSACFLKDNNLIVGYESGLIQIIDQKADNRVIRNYEGHTSSVSRLEVSETKNIFLSVSRNDVYVWKLPDLDSNCFGSGDRTPSPSQRQTDFTNLFNNTSLEIKSSWITIEQNTIVSWATFSPSGLRLATCLPLEQKVEVRNIVTDAIFRIALPATCCLFSQNEELLIIGCNISCIIIHNIVNNSCVSRIKCSYPVLQLFALPASNEKMKFGGLTKTNLCVWEVQDEDNNHNVPCLTDYNRGETEFYKCCAAVPDGSAVAVATTRGKILICDPSDGTNIREVGDSNSNIKYLAMDKTKEYRLMACVDDNPIRLWTLGELQAGIYAAMKKNFVVAWSEDDTLVLVAPTHKNHLKKVTGKSQFEEDLLIPVSCEIHICAISKCGKIIVASSSDREVYLHMDGNDSKMVKICKVEENIIKLKVEMFQNTICTGIGCDRSLTIWMSEEDKLDSALIFKKTFRARLVDYFIDLPFTNLITITQTGSIVKWHLDGRDECLDEVRKARLDMMVRGTALWNDVLVILDEFKNFLNIYNLEKKEETKKKLSSSPRCCSFSTDGKFLAIGFLNGTIEVWDMSSLQKCSSDLLKMDLPIESVCVSKGGMVGAATNRRVVMKPIKGKLGQAKLQVERILMSPDDSTLITVDSEGHMHLVNILNKTTDFNFQLKPLGC